MQLILASTSPYRKKLLERLHLPFECVSPATDESPVRGELPAARALRLALHKAHSVAAERPHRLILGSDQVAAIGETVLRKPGSRNPAIAQLQASQGKAVDFYTAIALVNSETGEVLSHVEPFRVYFKALTQAQIEHYIDLDKPYDCAGSFKWESLGIALFERLSGDDPTSLEGLPLIALTTLLDRGGMPVLGNSKAI
ncbi:MAG: Maf family nucleotide pyrophosphatase [Halioglobus sp.]